MKGYDSNIKKAVIAIGTVCTFIYSVILFLCLLFAQDDPNSVRRFHLIQGVLFSTMFYIATQIEALGQFTANLLMQHLDEEMIKDVE